MWTPQLAVALSLVLATSAAAWNNGPSGNARTDEPSECPTPSYATHDWIADHALALLPDSEKAWLLASQAPLPSGHRGAG